MNRLLILWWNMMCTLAFPAAAGDSPLAVVADGGASPAPASAQPAAAVPNGAQPASPAGGQPSGATPAPNPAAPQGQPNDANLAQLRTNYEKYRGLGEYDQVQSGLKNWQAINTKATELADALGYTRDSLAEAMADDPIGTLNLLASEHAKATASGQPPDVNKLVQQAVKPVLDQFAQQRADAAQAKFDNEVTRLMQSHESFKGMDISTMPEQVRDAIQSLVAASIQGDREAMNRLVHEGKVSDVQKHFTTAITSFLGVINAWNQYLSKAPSAPPAKPADGAPPAKLTLDDFINATPEAMKAAKTFSY